jgi:hypothetical protein
VGDALVVVVDGHRQHALGLFLAHHVLIQPRVDLLGRQARARAKGGQVVEQHALVLALQHLVAQVHALVADVRARLPSDQAGDVFFFALAERAALDLHEGFSWHKSIVLPFFLETDTECSPGRAAWRTLGVLTAYQLAGAGLPAPNTAA